MKKLYIFIFALCFASLLTAQDEAIFNHYVANPLLINPASAGFDDNFHQVFLHLKSAWSGFPGSPKTYAGNYNGPLGANFGVGFSVYSENLAEYRRLRTQANLAYKFYADRLKVAFGFSPEFHRLSINPAVLNSPQYQPGDGTIENMVDGENVFDVSFGIYGTYEGNTRFGISIPGVIQNRLDKIETGGDRSNPFDYTFLIAHMFETENGVSVEPSIFFKKVRNAPLQVDANVLGSFMEKKLITGLSYRGGTGGGLGILLGTKYRTMRLMYSYDIFFGDFQQYNNGTHEVSLNFELPRKEGKYDRSKKFRNDSNRKAKERRKRRK